MVMAPWIMSGVLYCCSSCDWTARSHKDFAELMVLIASCNDHERDFHPEGCGFHIKMVV